MGGYINKVIEHFKTSFKYSKVTDNLIKAIPIISVIHL